VYLLQRMWQLWRVVSWWLYPHNREGIQVHQAVLLCGTGFSLKPSWIKINKTPLNKFLVQMACLKGKLLFVQFSDFHGRILRCVQGTFLVRDFGLIIATSTTTTSVGLTWHWLFMYTYLELFYKESKNVCYCVCKIIMLCYCIYTEQILNVGGHAFQFWLFM